MKLTLKTYVTGFVLAGALVIGCQSMYSAQQGGTGVDATPTPTPDGTDNANGFFVDGSHDVDGGGPPPTPDEVAEEGEETQSHFRAIQIDPGLEDTAGPKFLKSADFDGDGLLDILSGHNQSQPVQLHLQRRVNGVISFETVTLGGTFPIATMSGVEIADMDQDGALDVVVLVKHNGTLAICLDGKEYEPGYTGEIIILFSPPPGGDITDGDAWQQVRIQDSNSGFDNRWGRATDDGRAIDYPEDGGYTSLSVADIDGLNGPDIIVTSNVAAPPCNTGQNVVAVWLNPGANARNGASQNISGANPPALTTPPTFWYPIWVDIDAPVVKDSEVMDVDGDGDIDIIAAYSNAVTQNIRWYRNPLVEQGAAAVSAGVFMNSNAARYATNWELRPIGQVDGNVGAITLGDMDGDGFDDLLARSIGTNVAVWFRRPTTDTNVEPIFPPNLAPDPVRVNFPWQVYALDDYDRFRANGIAIGDLTTNGANNAAVAVGGRLLWYDHTISESGSVFDEWGPDFVLDDTKEQGTTDDPTSLQFADDGTLINNLIIIDLDGDGLNDIVATFDRRVASGIADDEIVWFRNTLKDEDE